MAVFTIFNSTALLADQLVVVEGVVTKNLIDEGSHSERIALGLKLSDSDDFIVVRMRGDNAFQVNQDLLNNIGNQAMCEGVLTDSNVLVEATCVFNDSI